MGSKKKHTAKHVKAFMFFLSVLVILGAIVFANSFTGVTGAVTADDLNDDVLLTYKEAFNEKANGMPDIVFRIFGEEVINIYLSDIDVTLYAVLQDGELVDLEQGEQESPTMTITTTYDTVVKLQQHDITLSQTIDDGLVSFSSDSYIKEAMLSTVLYSIDIYDMFA
ncbi:MAG: hypothetical protein WC254_02670 [Candidatus Woesearchaeota archaeon]|jgi:hypothetical protein